VRPFVTLAALAVAACSSSYHPEYHPVSVSNVSQNIAYPAANGGVDRVFVVPATPAPVVVAPDVPPSDFFK
jgi:hypothetical protein